jgi:hypothetical protein
MTAFTGKAIVMRTDPTRFDANSAAMKVGRRVSSSRGMGPARRTGPAGPASRVVFAIDLRAERRSRGRQRRTASAQRLGDQVVAGVAGIGDFEAIRCAVENGGDKQHRRGRRVSDIDVPEDGLAAARHGEPAPKSVIYPSISHGSTDVVIGILIGAKITPAHGNSSSGNPSRRFSSARLSSSIRLR